MYIPIDLSKYYNHIIYKNEVIERDIYLNKKTIYGIPHVNNIHVIDEKSDDRNVFGMKFQFALKYNTFDNIMCDGQCVLVDINNIRRISFLGFSEMGTVCDDVKIHTEGGMVITIPLILKTFHSDSFKGIDDEKKNLDCKLAFYMNGDDGQKHGAYFWSINLSKNYNVKLIELPVNCSMHLFAITLN